MESSELQLEADTTRKRANTSTYTYNMTDEKRGRSRSHSTRRSLPTTPDEMVALAKIGVENKPTSPPPGSGWIRCIDETYNQHYYYNLETGESRWDTPDEFLDAMKIKETQDSTKPSLKLRCFSSEVVGADDTAGENLSVTGHESPSANPEEEYYPANRIKRLFYFHALCCEGPATFFETLLRSPGYMIGGLCIFLAGLVSCNPELRDLGCQWLREALLFFASAVTLSIPVTLLFVYRDYKQDEDWELLPLPTFAGWVDPRRFYVLCRGQGDSATNVMLHDILEESMDTIGRSILHPAHVVSIERLPTRQIPMHKVPHVN